MQLRGVSIVGFLAVILVTGMVSGSAAERGRTAAEPQPPVQISADVAEYFNKDGRAFFTGNVVAVQADSTLTADRMEVLFSETVAGAAGADPGTGTAGGGQRIAGITAEKNVSLRQIDPETKKERYATGEKAVYDADLRLVTLTGSPRMWEGKNVIVGEEINFHLDDKKVIVKGKVSLTVFPEEPQEEKNP